MKRVLTKILLVFGGAISGLAVIKIGFRIFYPQQTIDNLETAYDFPCYKAKDYYWLGLIPNKVCNLKSNGGAFDDFQVSINSLGLRGKEIAVQKPENTIRILFLGDSFTFGIGVKDEETYPSQVEKLLQEKFPVKREQTYYSNT